MVAFEPICMPTMCFLKNFKVLVLLWMFKDSKNSKFLYRILSTHRRFFTAYSVHGEDFSPHTQESVQVEHIFPILSTRGIFFTEYSVDVEYFYCIHSTRGIISKICHPALLCQLRIIGIIFTPYSVHVGDFYRILCTH